MGDITSRRGRVEGMEARGNAQVVRAMVPLAEMFGYATALRSNTQVFVVIHVHSERTATLRIRTKCSSVTEHFSKRNHSTDNLSVTASFHTFYADHYEEVPKSVSEEIIKKNKGE